MDKIIVFLCVFMYFMSPYRLLGHEMPEIIGLIALILQIFRFQKIALMPGYGIFLLYMLIIPPIASLMGGLPGNYIASFIPVSLIYYSLLFTILLPNLNWDYVLKFYRFLVYIAAGFFLFQEFSYYTIGIRPTLYLPLDMYYKGSDISEFSASRSLTIRSSSFFLEPAHFAQYILPYYCIVICRFVKERTNRWEFFLLSLIILLLRTGSGYWGAVAIIASLLFMPGYLSKRMKMVVATIVLLMLGGIVYFLQEDPLFLGVYSRIDEITSLEVDAYGRQSGFLRIWRGYFIYGAMEPINQLLGVGVGSIEYVSRLIRIVGSRYEGSYMNGIQLLLVNGGIVGALLFFRFLYYSFKKTSSESVIIIACMISLFFVEHMFFTSKMFLFVLIALAVSRQYRFNEANSHLKKAEATTSYIRPHFLR